MTQRFGVPGAQPSTPSGSGGPGEHRELVAQQDVLEDEVPARARPGNDACEQEPDAFQHVLGIADLPHARGFAASQLYEASANARLCALITDQMRTLQPNMAYFLEIPGRLLDTHSDHCLLLDAVAPRCQPERTADRGPSEPRRGHYRQCHHRLAPASCTSPVRPTPGADGPPSGGEPPTFREDPEASRVSLCLRDDAKSGSACLCARRRVPAPPSRARGHAALNAH
jgi:hypothetical protein